MSHTDEELRTLYETDGRTISEVAKTIGVSRSTAYKRLRLAGVQTRPRHGQVKDLLGLTLGHWTVVAFSHIEDRVSVWRCQCVCGETGLVSSRKLLSSKYSNCGCQKDPRHRGHGDILGTYWWFVVHGAKVRHLELTVTIQDAWHQFLGQRGFCALTGVPIVLAKTAKEFTERRQTASFDRLDSSRGYVPGNTQWTHKDVNMLKSNFPQKELFYWTKRIYDHNNLGNAA